VGRLGTHSPWSQNLPSTVIRNIGKGKSKKESKKYFLLTRAWLDSHRDRVRGRRMAATDRKQNFFPLKWGTISITM